VLLLVLVLGAGSACTTSSGAGTNGPLENSGVADGTKVCVPVKTGTTLAFGAEIPRNTGHEDVVIDGVGLAAPHGLRLVEAVLVAARDNLVGLELYPPSDEPGFDWAGRRPAVGATLAPQAKSAEAEPGSTQSAGTASASASAPTQTSTSGSSGTVRNLVVAIRVTGTARAQMSGVTVTYHVGGATYQWRDFTELVVETKKSRC